MVQNLMGKILMNLTNFQQFINIFPIYQNFSLVSYLPLMNLWRSSSTRNKIIAIGKAPPRIALFAATAQGSWRFPTSRELCLLAYPIHLRIY